ncbi:ppsD [Symbiodinium pilosum]|uniref:PpsD protein n=1 Tax=Symbiodinium pilosum TaxID=2952 RepID=A0A812QFL6_SYMPI|nr:ppsD [Symbiodinium pilosum]
MEPSPVDNLPTRFVKNQTGTEGEAISWDAVKKLRIKQSSADNPIHLHEIEIYGCDGINYALPENGGTACQSSMHGSGDGYGPAEFVIDGRRNGPVNHTKHAANGWLEVELAAATAVESFAIFNMSDDEYDHRVRLNGHTVELLDESDQIVYQQQITMEEDGALFDRKKGCKQLWVNEDAKSVVANLSIEKGVLGHAKIIATQMSGTHIASISIDAEWPQFSANVCNSIAEESQIPAYNLRLLLPDGRLLRLHDDEEMPG